MNAQTAWNQIPVMTKMEIGARDPIADGSTGLIFRIGSGRKLAKVVVTLAPDDTYSVRLVVLSLKTYAIKTDETVDGVYFDSLSQVLRSLASKV